MRAASQLGLSNAALYPLLCAIFTIFYKSFRQSRTEAREENGNAVAVCCTWAPKGSVAKVRVICLANLLETYRIELY